MSKTGKENIPKNLIAYAPIVFVVNILSHKWALFILLSLMKPMRFNQLRRYLDISHSVLSKELKGLEKLQLISRKIIDDTNPPSVEYSLTDKGKQLLELCKKMEEFGIMIESDMK